MSDIVRQMFWTSLCVLASPQQLAQNHTQVLRFPAWHWLWKSGQSQSLPVFIFFFRLSHPAEGIFWCLLRLYVKGWQTGGSWNAFIPFSQSVWHFQRGIWGIKGWVLSTDFYVNRWPCFGTHSACSKVTEVEVTQVIDMPGMHPQPSLWCWHWNDATCTRDLWRVTNDDEWWQMHPQKNKKDDSNFILPTKKGPFPQTKLQISTKTTQHWKEGFWIFWDILKVSSLPTIQWWR